MREELIFALVDICAAVESTAEERPLIPERESAELDYRLRNDPQEFPTTRGLRFGCYIDRLDGLPITDCLGLTSLQVADRFPHLKPAI
jgi:hypothetical protein